MIAPAVHFWGRVALAALGIAVAVWHVRARPRRVFLAVITVIAAAALGLCAWQLSDSVFGECAGARGTTVPYREGMTLCPGQGTTYSIEIPIAPPAPHPAPASGRDL